MRRAVGMGRGERDPEVHLIKGQLADERALSGRGTTAQEYRKLQNAAHAHMKGGAMAGGAPSLAGGRPQLAGGRAVGAGTMKGEERKTARKAYEGGAKMSVEEALRLLGAMDGKKAVGGRKKKALPAVAPMAAGAGSGETESEEEMVEAVGGRKKRAKAGPSDARRKRGAMVSKLMKEKGMTLGEASKYIKEHGGV